MALISVYLDHLFTEIKNIAKVVFIVQTQVIAPTLASKFSCTIVFILSARYQQDYDDMGSTVLSQRYYYQALTLFPDMGQN